MAKEKLGVNPWLKIWVNPRETIQKIVEYNPKHRFVILSFLYGLPMVLHIAQGLSLTETLSILGIVIAALVVATFAGMLGIVVASALITWTGKWIGGKAGFQHVRSAVAWSNVPNIFSIVIWAFLICTFHDRIFLDTFNEQAFAGRELAIVSTALFLQGVLAVWSFVILVKGIGQVQGFSAWKGVLNVLIPFFLVGIVIWMISWLSWTIFGFAGI
ncbi:MAG: hypothetical protein KR126chlam1_01308 [Chlamydiae bacterium]|nr:hypothetical protein [Chlamydiota bacterium]